MFSHHPSIHHFILNDPPSPKSKRQVIHLEDEGDITPRQEFTDPFIKEEKVSRVFFYNLQGLVILLYLLPTQVNFRILRTSTQHLYAPAADVAPHQTIVIPSFVDDPSKPPLDISPRCPPSPPYNEY
jgi:hypothetical protein